jgi:PhoH-like ATPase
MLRVRYNGNLKSYHKETNVDFHVIQIADLIRTECEETIIVTNDINIRIRANALGFKAEPYFTRNVEKIYKGHSEIWLTSESIAEMYEKEIILINELDISDELKLELHPNHYLSIRSLDDLNATVLAKVLPDGYYIAPITEHHSAYGIKGRNIEQKFAMDALLDPNISLVMLSGRAGCGKTLLACAAGYQSITKNNHKRMLVSRPIMPMGKDLGFLPGEIDEKLDPWMQPIYDAFEAILTGHDGKEYDGKSFVTRNSMIKIEPLTYIRGRSIRKSFILIDEAQNLSRLEIKTIITRAGEDTKLVFTGDIDQIDNPYLTKYSNGLSVAMDAFSNSKLSATVVMEHGIRSSLSDEATRRL